MKKNFYFEFIDESSQNAISFEYDNDIDEEMEVIIENRTPILYANRQGLLALAKILIKIAICNYKDGFHLHLRKDFDADKPETMLCILKDK